MVCIDLLASAEAEAAAAEVDSTPKKGSAGGGKNGKKGGKGGAANAKANTATAAAPRKDTPAMLANKAVKALDWNALFYSRGMPTKVTSFANSLSTAAEALAAKWIATAATYKYDAPPANTNADDIKVS